MQTAGAFDQVQSSLSFIVNSYTDIAEWQSVVQRLVGFHERVHAIADQARQPQRIAVRREGLGVAVREVDLDLPDGTPLLRGVTLEAGPGEALLVTGPTGIGKSTLIRAIAGIWPFGRGEIRLGEGPLLFLPQRPYLPLGTLRNALLYPRPDEGVPEARLGAVLGEVGLGRLAGELDTEDNWAQRLSLGEQQRLAFARVLLVEPRLLFLDEATSALDEPAEARLYGLLRELPERPTIVCVGHRSTLLALHDRSIDVSAFRVRAPDLVVAS
jgi:putative ATP-binding cassette transporter